jgi:lysophospholipase L1-like esterase
VTSATKLLVPELVTDGYISDSEWFIQLSADQQFMSKFAQEFKALTIQNTDKLELIYKNWNDVHPNLAGYEVLAKKITNYLL